MCVQLTVPIAPWGIPASSAVRSRWQSSKTQPLARNGPTNAAKREKRICDDLRMNTSGTWVPQSREAAYLMPDVGQTHRLFLEKSKYCGSNEHLPGHSNKFLFPSRWKDALPKRPSWPPASPQRAVCLSCLIRYLRFRTLKIHSRLRKIQPNNRPIRSSTEP